MNSHKLTLATLCLLATACGGASEVSDAAPADLNAPTVDGEILTTPTVLQTISAGGSTIEISKVATPDGEPFLQMREQGSAYQALLLDTLFEAHGELTTLETVLALQPSLSVPQDVIAAHEVEAKAMGRETMDVKSIDFDVDAAVEKSFTTTACDQASYPYEPNKQWILGGKRDNVSGFTYACLANNCSTMTSRMTISRVCNNANTTVQARNAWDFDSVNPWNVTAWADVPVNGSIGWYMPSGPQRRYSSDGDSAAGKTYHSRSGAQAPFVIIR